PPPPIPAPVPDWLAGAHIPPIPARRTKLGGKSSPDLGPVEAVPVAEVLPDVIPVEPPLPLPGKPRTSRTRVDVPLLDAVLVEPEAKPSGLAATRVSAMDDTAV